MPARSTSRVSRRAPPWSRRASRSPELLGARPSEIVFTSGGTEGDNLALFGLVAAGDHVVSSAIEHHAVLNSCKRLEEMGVAVTYVACGADGVVRPEDVRAALRPETKLISVMMANNETGALQPVEEIGEIARRGGRVLPHRRGAGGRQGADRRGADWLRPAGHCGAQNARAAGRGRAVRAAGQPCCVR